jgi:peptidoglycan/xylan/chitin deacetylase (PgdA/CDA1 family)
MNIYITLDYELFFGDKSGSIEQCIIKPTEALLNIVDPYNIKFTCFVDAGYLLALERQKDDYIALKGDFDQVISQIKKLSKNGHGVELHIHPHWEDSFYNGKKWVFNTQRYKLSDFNEVEILDIVSRYTSILKKVTGKAPVAFRAGGWSAQPFKAIQKALSVNNIFIDSTVFAKGFHNSCHQMYDFREVPEFLTKYKFSDDLTLIDNSGTFTEIPISSYKVSPLFFWKFAIKKFFKKTEHKAFGNGSALSMPKKEMLRLLFTFSNSVVSIDGFKASLIEKAFERYKKQDNDNDNFVLIGHPKAFTPYSIQKIDNFIKNHHRANTFVTYSDLI